MSNWLISWKTWMEGEVDTPWPFQLVQHTSEYRKRGTGEKISDDSVDAVYFSGNENSVIEFENAHISAVVLGTMIESNDPIDAVNSVKNCFPDAEFVNVAFVPNELVEKIQAQLEKDQRPI